jgi:hypothetical protein
MQKKALSGLFAALLAASMFMAASAQAASHMAPGATDMGKTMTKEMKADKDGMVTREEFMKKMGEMFDKMDKNKTGKVPMSDLERFFNTGGA